MFELFRTMDRGGDYGADPIPYFNGKLFADVRPFDLTFQEIEEIRKVSRLNWAEVDASIFGTLFEYGIDPEKYGDVGTHYTSREDIATLIEPVIMAPLRKEWAVVKGLVDDVLAKVKPPRVPMSKTSKVDSAPIKKANQLIADFLQRLRDVTVLDPACGSGNFLFVALQFLKDLEKEVVIYAARNKLSSHFPTVGPWQLFGIEKSPFAFELARTTIWIGWLQWTKANGYKVDWEPILRSLDHIVQADALVMADTDGTMGESAWPAAEFIVGNPPFLGAKKFRTLLGDPYTDALFKLFGDRIPNFSDLCCYWFEKARHQIESGKTRRVGLLATQGIRGGSSCEVLKRISKSGQIFFARSNRSWILDGANVGVSMIGFDGGAETRKQLDEIVVNSINPDLTASSDLTACRRLPEARKIGFYADVKSGSFDLPIHEAMSLLGSPNPHGKPNSDVVRPWSNGRDVVQRATDSWIIDFGVNASREGSRLYEEPFRLVSERVRPEREKVKRKRYRDLWWLHAEPCGEMRRAIAGLDKYIATTIVAKHRLFVRMPSYILPDHALFVVAKQDDYTLGVLQSKAHAVWSLRRGTFLETRPRYTPTTCFETFPFPRPFAALEAEIGAAASDLDRLRRNWLNPFDWTRSEIFEFPASTTGPWGRLVEGADAEGVGVARYKRQVPKSPTIAAKLGQRTLTHLYNVRPEWLDAAHRRLDEAVFAAYGWKSGISESEIVSELLALNLARADEASEAASSGILEHESGLKP